MIVGKYDGEGFMHWPAGQLASWLAKRGGWQADQLPGWMASQTGSQIAQRRELSFFENVKQNYTN